MNKVLVMAMAIAIISISAQIGSASPIMKVEPSYLSVSHGDTFTVNITVDPNGTEIYGADYILHFNNIVLRALSQNKGPFLGPRESTYVISTIDNTHGIADYGETITTGSEHGVTNPGVLATIEFEVRSPGVSELRFGEVILSDPDGYKILNVTVNNGTVETTGAEPSSPFLVSGYVFYENGSKCNNPRVNITNLNTSEGWQAETSPTSNYYQLVLRDGIDIVTGETLQFNIKSIDGSHFNTTNHTIMQEDVNLGGVFNFNFTTVRTGDVNCDGDVNMGDVILLLNNLNRAEKYPICNRWVGDVNCDDAIDMKDVRLLLNHVGDPDRYPLGCDESC